MSNINTKLNLLNKAQTLYTNFLDSYKEHPDLRKEIRKASVKICEELVGVDYLESNFRRMLARELSRRGLDVYQEVIIPYTFNAHEGYRGEPIPFGHGFADIVIYDRRSKSSIILELKITAKDCARQLGKYMRHWKYTPILFGMTVNFSKDSVYIQDYEQEKKEEKSHFHLNPQREFNAQEVKCNTISGC